MKSYSFIDYHNQVRVTINANSYEEAQGMVGVRWRLFMISK